VTDKPISRANLLHIYSTSKLNRASWKLVRHQNKAPRLEIEPVCERFHSRSIGD
jgi:hypothetical protein